MKIKLLALVVLTGFIGTRSQASFEQFADPLGYMNVFDLAIDANTNYSAGGYLWGSAWALPDLQSITSDNKEWLLIPNTNVWNEGDPYYVRTNTIPYDGNKWMNAVTYYELPGHAKGTETNLTMIFRVDANDLDSSRYTLTQTIRVFVPDFSSFISQDIVITSNDVGTVITNSWEISPSLDQPVQLGFTLDGPNANPAVDWGSATITVLDVVVYDGDTNAPVPNPMTFAVEPYPVSDSVIGMTATTASDTNGVQYFFSNTVSGATSGWQSGTTWNNGGLNDDTLYSYRVKARDLSAYLNETAWSDEFSATTLILDTDAPTPDPMTFDSSDASPQSVKLTATTASDASVVEYFFDCVAGDGVDSGWQSSPVYVNTALASSSNYTYRVRARDLSSNTNMTGWSTNIVVTTLPYPGSYAMSNSLKDYTGNSNQGETVHEVLKGNLEFANYDELGRRISFNGSGAMIGGFTAGDAGRNNIRTLANEYANTSFEAWVTASGWTGNENIFIGFGPGDIGAYGVPDWSPNGENTHASFICEINGTSAGIWSQTNNSVANWAQAANVGTSLTTGTVQRIKLAFDNSTQQGTLVIDVDYDGSNFDSNVVVGPVTAPDFSISESKIYLGGDDGIILSNFEIVGAAAPVVGVGDLAIQPVSGGMLLTWSSVLGQTYDVEYKTDLTAGSWTTELSDIPGTGGGISATSTVGAAEAFYQVSTQ